MVADMVEKFREMQRILAERIEQYDTPEFRALDESISQTFEAICRHEPKNVGEARAMAELFLDMIAHNDNGDNVHLIERVRILTLGFEQQEGPASPRLHSDDDS